MSKANVHVQPCGIALCVFERERIPNLHGYVSKGSKIIFIYWQDLSCTGGMLLLQKLQLFIFSVQQSGKKELSPNNQILKPWWCV